VGARRILLSAALALFLASSPRPLAAQAFTPPQGLGAVTLSWQYVDNTGHRLSDGFFVERGQSVTTSADLELEYGVTDRLAATVAVPYVFARYTGAMPPPSNLPLDACACWHSSFQDFALAARYRLGRATWAVTPLVRVVLPSHGYGYRGEAVVGRRLREAQVGVSAGLRLAGPLSKASIHSTYVYSLVEKPLEEIGLDHSNAFFEAGYAVTRRLYVRADATWQRTHGGVRAGSTTGQPFPLPGELNTLERIAQRDRILRTNYWHTGGGLSYSAGPVDVFASVSKYVSGTDTHNGRAFTLGATYYFDLAK